MPRPAAAPSPGPTGRFVRALLPYARGVAGPLAAGTLASIASNLAIVLPAVLLGRALDAVVAWQAGRVSARAAQWAVAAWVGGVVLREGPRIIRRWLLGVTVNRILTRMRADAMDGVLAWPLARLHRFATGDLMARIVGDVDVVGTGVKELTTNTWDTLLSTLVTLGTLLAYHPSLTLLALVPFPAAILLAHATRRWVAGRTAAAREANAALTTALQEQLVGARLLRLFGRTGAAVERVHALADAQARANVAVIRLREGLTPVYRVLMAAGVVVVIARGGREVAAGAMSVGSFVAYLELFIRFAARGDRIPRWLNRLQSAGASWERLEPLLERGPAPAAPRAAAGTGAVRIELRDVAFRYPGAARRALDGVSLDLAPGSLVAVTGPVGSGKSALARAVLGLYPLEAGEVRWDGAVPAGGAPPPARYGYLPQDPGLFAGTVRENIMLAWPAQGADVAPHASRAALDEDLAGFPHGLDTQIGETGIRISGGQRQRVALARALAVALPGHPGLLVLDDPFAAVDGDTEARIVRTLVAHHGPTAPPDRRATILLLSHRLAVFPLADRVVVLDAGRIREAGTHAALVEAGGLYARIVAAQTRIAGGSAR